MRSKRISTLHADFCAKYPHINISLEMFRTAIPWDVRKGRDSTCLCVHCERITELLKALRKNQDMFDFLTAAAKAANAPDPAVVPQPARARRFSKQRAAAPPLTAAAPAAPQPKLSIDDLCAARKTRDILRAIVCDDELAECPGDNWEERCMCYGAGDKKQRCSRCGAANRIYRNQAIEEQEWGPRDSPKTEITYLDFVEEDNEGSQNTLQRAALTMASATASTMAPSRSSSSFSSQLPSDAA